MLVVLALRLTLPRALFLLLEALFLRHLPLLHDLLGVLHYLPARFGSSAIRTGCAALH